MENQQPIKQKDLTFQDFLEEIARENKYPSWKKVGIGISEYWMRHAAERYATYKEQQAKHAGFIEGCKAQKFVCAENAGIKILWVAELMKAFPELRTNINRIIAQESILEAPLPDNPYKPREKGGEDES